LLPETAATVQLDRNILTDRKKGMMFGGTYRARARKTTEDTTVENFRSQTTRRLNESVKVRACEETKVYRNKNKVDKMRKLHNMMAVPLHLMVLLIG
jgi:hypothetical protein